MIASIDRRRIYIFVAITFVASIAVASAVFSTGGIFIAYPSRVRVQAGTLITALMLAPGIANIATRLITREGWSNMLLWPRFRRGWPYYLVAWILPPLATIAGGTVYYLLFPDRFDPLRTYATKTLGVNSLVDGPPTTVLLVQTLYIMVAVLFALHWMFGEEFGWRGYLLPKLMPLGARKAVLLVGVIWGVWHWPLILMGYDYGFDYWGAPVVGPLLWLLMCCFMSTILAWITLRSGSVWPAVLAHGMVNGSGLLMLRFIRGAPDSLIGPLTGGIIGSLGYALLAVLIFFSTRALAPMAAPPAPPPKPLPAPAHGAAD